MTNNAFLVSGMGQFLAPKEGFGPRLFFARWPKKGPFCCFGSFCSVVNLVTFCRIINSFRNNPKISKINKKYQMNLQNLQFFLAIFLVLPLDEICLQPELSNPPIFRIQGGSLSVTDRWKTDGQTEILVSNFGFNNVPCILEGHWLKKTYLKRGCSILVNADLKSIPLPILIQVQ